MPRRNHTPKHARYDPTPLAHTARKRAFATKRDAEAAVRKLQAYDINLQLSVYQSPIDGKWYLSSRTNTRYS